MKQERTLSIIKPDAVAAAAAGAILARLEAAGLRLVAQKMIRLERSTAEQFYAEHSERPFFASLVEFMMSGPLVVQVLAGAGAIALNRRIMGATDPAAAEPGTIRADFGTDVGRNAVHGSDSAEAAAREIACFFNSDEIFDN